MKKLIGLILIIMMLLSLVACGSGASTYSTVAPTEASPIEDSRTFSERNSGEMNMAKLNIVCANFPEYDWVSNLIKGSDNVDTWLLVDDGTDIHSFQPSVDDMVKVSNCDMFIYSGAEGTSWMADLLKNAENENMTVIDMLDFPYCYVICSEHDHDEEGTEEEEHHAYDEHVWLSLNNAKNVCKYIYECLTYMDTEHVALYEANYESYVAKLTELDDAYKLAVESSENKSLVFADRFPFVYMMDDYALGYSAAFPGCSTETDASFQTIITLAERVDELKLKNVVVLENSNTDVAKSVIENTKVKNVEVVTMNSMQSVTAKDIDGGATYLNIMEENLVALTKALGTIEE